MNKQNIVTILSLSAMAILFLIIVLSDANDNNKVFILTATTIMVLSYLAYRFFDKKKFKKIRKEIKVSLKNSTSRKNVITIGLSLCAIVICVIMVVSKINFSGFDDARKARDFTPSPEIQKLIDGLNLTNVAKDILYASSPQLKDKQAFNGICGHDGDPDAYIAGCYYKKGDDEYIDIFNAGSDANGLQNAYYNYDNAKKVTLSHEMLHAAYARLSDNEKQKINDELNKIYASNKEIREELKGYPESQKYDELYTRSATEIYSLSNILEDHYRKYFKDRQSIAKMYHDCKSQIDDMLTKADEVMAKIQQQEKLINSATSIASYNSAVTEYNKLVDIYNDYVDVFRDTLDKRDSEK